MKNLFRNVGSQLGSECCLAFVACTTSAGDPLQKARVIGTTDGDAHQMFWLRVPAARNKFAEWLDWWVRDFNDANHAPVVKVHGESSHGVMPDEKVTRVADLSGPDRDKLRCRWWQHGAADSVQSTLNFQAANSDTAEFDCRMLADYANDASFVVPDEPKKQIQIILEVADNGTPWLAGYHRVICGVQGN